MWGLLGKIGSGMATGANAVVNSFKQDGLMNRILKGIAEGDPTLEALMNNQSSNMVQGSPRLMPQGVMQMPPERTPGLNLHQPVSFNSAYPAQSQEMMNIPFEKRYPALAASMRPVVPENQPNYIQPDSPQDVYHSPVFDAIRKGGRSASAFLEDMPLIGHVLREGKAELQERMLPHEMAKARIAADTSVNDEMMKQQRHMDNLMADIYGANRNYQGRVEGSRMTSEATKYAADVGERKTEIATKQKADKAYMDDLTKSLGFLSQMPEGDARTTFIKKINQQFPEAEIPLDLEGQKGRIRQLWDWALRISGMSEEQTSTNDNIDWSKYHE